MTWPLADRIAKIPAERLASGLEKWLWADEAWPDFYAVQEIKLALMARPDASTFLVKAAIFKCIHYIATEYVARQTQGAGV